MQRCLCFFGCVGFGERVGSCGVRMGYSGWKWVRDVGAEVAITMGTTHVHGRPRDPGVRRRRSVGRRLGQRDYHGGGTNPPRETRRRRSGAAPPPQRRTRINISPFSAADTNIPFVPLVTSSPAVHMVSDSNPSPARRYWPPLIARLRRQPNSTHL